MSTFSTILVPQGAEFQAVCRGLGGLSSPTNLQAIPMGMDALSEYLQQNRQVQTLTQKPDTSILLMGLCGSLNPNYRIGDRVIYQGCQSVLDPNPNLNCDPQLTSHLQAHLKASLVSGLTCDRIVHCAAEKQHLGQSLHLDVVDMEGSIILDFFSQFSIPVAIVRVVSDDCFQDLPNLNSALDKNGQLQTLPLIIAMLGQPMAAVHLIRGSLTGLQQLTSTVKSIFGH